MRLNPSIVCSFCDEQHLNRRDFIMGPSVSICRECIELARNLLNDKNDKDDKDDKEYCHWAEFASGVYAVGCRPDDTNYFFATDSINVGGDFKWCPYCRKNIKLKGQVG